MTNRVNISVMKEMLEMLHYRVLPVGSGQEAVAVYMEKGKEIDLVILDMIMPGISGGGHSISCGRSIRMSP